METMRKSVYPVHKLETTINDDMGSIDDDSTDFVEGVDDRINVHYFDIPIMHKAQKKDKFKPIARPNGVQKHTLGIRQERYVINDSKVDPLTKSHIYDTHNNLILLKLDTMLKLGNE